jgi:glycosyltransferase involved in cell wall biosynthesis
MVTMMNYNLLEIVADGRPGGGTTAVLGLCHDLMETGQRVTLLTDAGSYAADAARNLKLSVLELPFFRSRFDPNIALGIRKVLHQIKPDLVHTHGARAGLPLSLVPRRGERRVYTVHGFHFVGKRGLAQVLARASEARIAQTCDAGIFVSQSDQVVARDNGICFADEAVVYNGIDLKDIIPSADKPLFDLVFCARMHRQKNPLFIVDVMRVLAPEGVRMLVIGGGELDAQFRTGVKEAGIDAAVTFLGALPREQALAAMATARLFIMPSLWEGLPIAPIEALASGVPVIGSDIPGIREVVLNGTTGILVPGFQQEKWAQAIRGLLTTPERINTMALASQSDVRSRFTRERSSNAHRAIYSALLTERNYEQAAGRVPA